MRLYKRNIISWLLIWRNNLYVSVGLSVCLFLCTCMYVIVWAFNLQTVMTFALLLAQYSKSCYHYPSSLPLSLFIQQGLLKSTITCLSCHKHRVVFEPFVSLSVPIPPGRNSCTYTVSLLWPNINNATVTLYVHMYIHVYSTLQYSTVHSTVQYIVQ